MKLKYLLLSLTVLFFTACGSTNTGDSTVDTAIDKIIAYAQNGTPVPTVQDYLDAGIIGITSENLDEINEVVGNLRAEEVDTTEEIQAITDSLDVSLAPVAVATISKSLALEGETIHFSAEDSTDADGSIVGYEWKEGDVLISSISEFDKSDFSVGIHTLTLTVMDDDDNTNSTTVTVTIEAIIQLIPVAVATVSHTTVTEGETIHFSAEDSTDADGSIVGYEWKEGDVLISSISEFDKSDFSVGIHTLTLTVMDDDDNTNSTTVTVTIEAIAPIFNTLTKRVHLLNGVCEVYVDKTGQDTNSNGVLEDSEVTSTTAETFTNGMPLTKTQLQTMITAKEDVTSVNTCQIIGMANLFNGNTDFNQDISTWNTGAVTSMAKMFYEASTFNQDISTWDTGVVTSMGNMFHTASNFNQNIGAWDVSSVKNMRFMLFSTSSFDQDLSGWNVSKVTDYQSFAKDSPISNTAKMPNFP